MKDDPRRQHELVPSGAQLEAGEATDPMDRKAASLERHRLVWEGLREQAFSILWDRHVTDRRTREPDPRDEARYWFDIGRQAEAAMRVLRKRERTPESIADLATHEDFQSRDGVR